MVFRPKLDEQFYIDKNHGFQLTLLALLSSRWRNRQAMYTGGSSGLPTTTEEVTGTTLGIKTTWA